MFHTNIKKPILFYQIKTKKILLLKNHLHYRLNIFTLSNYIIKSCKNTLKRIIIKYLLIS